MSTRERATDRYAKLSLAKQVLLQRRLRGELPGGKRRNAIPRRQNRETSPLSFAQQRLWFLDQLDSSRAYNIPKPVRLVGSLRVDALERALGEIIRRHEMLHTIFVEQDGTPVQVLKAQEQFTLPLTDLSHMVEREAELRRVAVAEAHRPFDLAAGPLLRVQLLRLAEEEHVVLFTMHHIISDGWSLGVLVKEVAALYEAYVKGEESPLPELEIQYADYAAWQREWLQGEVLEEQLSYWRRQLGGELPVLELPADRPRPAVQSYRGGRQSVTLSEDLTRQLKALSQREGCTLFMTLLAAFQVLLSRYSGQEDIVVGTPIANRTRSEVEPLIGFFVNTLALRTDLSGNPTFTELLRRVREVTLEAHAHQDLPFDKLVEELQPERDLSRTPLFQVMFALQNMPLDSLTLPGLTLVSEQIENLTSKFDLNLSTNEIGNVLHLVCEYSAELFETGSIERMLGHYQRVLEEVSRNAELRVWEIRLLDETQEQQLVEWNGTKRDYEQRGQCLHQLIEAQVKQTPEATAVVYEEEELSYGELNESANQLAHHLRALGVGPEVLVGVCLERSVEMVVSLLAVLKAGGAYVPLDPAYPRERLAYMLADADVSVLLTHSHLVTKLPLPEALPVVRVDEDWRLISAQRSDNPDSGVGPDNLAYVIYTSGSTGRPKGVMIPHDGICNRLLWMQETYNLNVFDRVLQKTTFSFDVSVWEFFWPLMTGAALVVAEPEGHRDSAYLVKLISEQAITTLHFVPSMLQVFLKEKELAACRSLERVICSGEALPFDLQQRFFGSLNAGLHNLYGPTEASIDVSYWECQRKSGSTTVPIGYPIANTELYVLDRHGQAVPLGVVGELHIGGLGLARGYLQRPELSAEKFIPDRFSGRAGARLYRTGDLVRYLADGEIEFLGRLDDQVKLRGYRIELGEIEAALTDQPGIREAVVIVRAEEQRLVGYVVTDDEVKVDDLRQALRAKLPEYMVPSALVVLEALPLTANGKLDRKALPAPDAIASAEEYVGPRTPVEEVLAGIYGEVLKLGQISVKDNFFELGGHSLLATRLVSKVREVFQIELPLRCVFESPTVAGMATVIERELRAGAGFAAPPIRVIGRDEVLPLSFAQQRLWFLEQLQPGSALYNIPLAVRLTGSLNLAAFEQTLNEIIRRHESLRTRFATLDGQPQQVIDDAEPLQLTPIELSGLPEPEAEVRRLAIAEAQQSFNLATGPLLRVQLLRVAEDEHVVLFTMHHIISDGWSLGVLVKEVATLYDAYIKGEASPLPALPIQYADYAAWQREWLQGDVLAEQLSYWQRQLAGELPVLELPTDKPRPAVQTHNGARCSLLIPAADSLKALSVQQGSTLFMTLLAAFATLLHYLTKQTDITVGTDIANRNRAETENLIGFFVNQLVLRVQVEHNLTFKALLGKVREATLCAYAHQDLPFEKLVETLNPDRDASRSPLFQVKMVLQNAPFEELKIPGVTLSPIKANSNTAKFDLLLNLYDTDHGLSAILDYNTDLFEADTAARILNQFCFLLDDIVERPGATLQELIESLTENDQRAQLEKEKELESLRLQKLRLVKRQRLQV